MYTTSRKRTSRMFWAGMIFVGFVSVVLPLAFAGALIYITIHFIHKLW